MFNCDYSITCNTSRSPFFFQHKGMCEIEYKPWKWGATARYDTSRTKTMLPTWKSSPRSSRQSDHKIPPDHRKERQTALVWSSLPFIRSGWPKPPCKAQWRGGGKKRRKTEEEVRKQHQGMDRTGFRQAPEGSGERRKMEESCCEIICGAPTTRAVKG